MSGVPRGQPRLAAHPGSLQPGRRGRRRPRAARRVEPRLSRPRNRARTGEYTQKELAERIGLDKTTMVVTVDELEEKGLAERRPSSTDRRARVISVTKAGERTVARGPEDHRPDPERRPREPAREGAQGLPRGARVAGQGPALPAGSDAAAAAPPRAPGLATPHSLADGRAFHARVCDEPHIRSSQDDLVRDYLLRSPYNTSSRPRGAAMTEIAAVERRRRPERRRATARVGSRWSSSASGC